VGASARARCARDASCTLSARLAGADVVFVGQVHRVTDPEELTRVAAANRADGWPAEVDGDAFTAPYTAPSGGPPSWNFNRIAREQAVGVGSGPPLSGATKWTFA
jgi:hypothetical protein